MDTLRLIKKLHSSRRIYEDMRKDNKDPKMSDYYFGKSSAYKDALDEVLDELIKE